MKKSIKSISLCFLSGLLISGFTACQGSAPAPTDPTASPTVTVAPTAAITPDVAKDASVVIEKNGIQCTLNLSTGLVTKISSDKMSLSLDGIFIDAGYNGNYPFMQLGFSSFEEYSTWQLPMAWPRKKELPNGCFQGYEETDNGFLVTMQQDGLTICYQYTMLTDAVKVSALLSTEEATNQEINGVAFLVKGICDFPMESTTFEFPGSTPVGQFSCANYRMYKLTSTDYSCPVIHFESDSRFLNVLYVNEQEKWTTGAFIDENEKPCALFLAATEGFLSSGTDMTVESLYIPLTPQDADPYLCVQEFWSTLGYHAPTDGIQDGPVYSAHPFGTMDTNYFNRLTLKEYAAQLESIASMGFENVWLLPVFWHTGDNVYEPIDQGVIDARYGGEAEAKYFIEAAHNLSLRVLFDLVPHGPRPVYEFAKEHADWVSKKKNGDQQIEWSCVSFDYNNPDYYSYTVNLLQYYAEEFGLDGARIDCAMGGLSNWEPQSGLRASSSGLAAGLNMTKAVREGFLAGGVNPVLLPENFHPVPYFAEYTDMFYDMPLFRALYDLNHANLSETEYTARLTHWLDTERKTSVDGLVKLRFLGNHDTVSWTFDAERAQTYYGVDKAKALWCIMSLIDGVPFIYQGDENPEAYQLSGENLTDFFSELLAARKTWLSHDFDIEYIDTGSPIFAFTRRNAKTNEQRLVLINLSEQAAAFDLGAALPAVLYQNGSFAVNKTVITLEPYCAIMTEGE